LHRQGRLVDRDQRQRFGRIDRRERRADVQVIDAGNEHDVPCLRGLDRLSLETGEAQHLPDASTHRRALAMQYRDVLSRNESSGADASEAETTDIARVVERADLELQRSVRVA